MRLRRRCSDAGMRVLVYFDIVDMIVEVIHQFYSTQQNFVCHASKGQNVR